MWIEFVAVSCLALRSEDSLLHYVKLYGLLSCFFFSKPWPVYASIDLTNSVVNATPMLMAVTVLCC